MTSMPALPGLTLPNTPATLPPRGTFRPLVERALEEDVGPGDITTQLTIPLALCGQAQIEAREDIVVCGVPVAAEVFQHMPQQHRIDRFVRPGPGRGLQIDHLIGVAIGEFVDVAVAIALLIATS